jgi:glycosyltransferase 2 family protein
MDIASRMKPRKKRRPLVTALKLAFSLSILAFLLITKTSVRDILRVLSGVEIPWMAAAFSLHAVGLFCSAYRWQILARAQGDVIPLGYLMKSYLVGTFFNNFLPTSFGGDVVRIWDGSKYSQSLVRSSAIVVVERLTGIIVLFLFAFIASLFRLDMANETPVIWVSLAVGLAGLACVALFLAPVGGRAIRALPDGKWTGAIREKTIAFRDVVLFYRHRKPEFLRASAWALILQANVVLYFFLIGKAFHLEIPFPDYFVFVPIVLLVQTIPVTINGLGLREGSTIAIFAYYAIPAQTAFSFSLIDFGFRLLLGIIGGILYAMRK